MAMPILTRGVLELLTNLMQRRMYLLMPMLLWQCIRTTLHTLLLAVLFLWIVNPIRDTRRPALMYERCMLTKTMLQAISWYHPDSMLMILSNQWYLDQLHHLQLLPLWKLGRGHIMPNHNHPKQKTWSFLLPMLKLVVSLPHLFVLEMMHVRLDWIVIQQWQGPIFNAV